MSLQVPAADSVQAFGSLENQEKLEKPSIQRTRDTRVGKLNAALVAKILRGPPCSPISDGGGLYLDHPRPNAGYWFYRWSRDGRDTRQDIGPTHTFSLAEARERARKLRQMRQDGLDPKLEREKQRRPQANPLGCYWQDFRAVDYGATSPKQQAEYDRFWQRDFRPMLGELDVARVGVDELVRALQPIYQRSTHGDRARSLLTRFFAYLQARDLRPDNPANGRLERLLPRHKGPVEHLAALPWREAPAFMARLRSTEGALARLDEVVILTGARAGELRLARWGWIDWNARTLTVPAGFVKGRAEHRKPLPSRVMEILHELPSQRDGEENTLIFTRSGKPFADCELTRVVQACAPEGQKVTLHGFRSTLRDWAAEATNFPREVCELALGHTIKRDVERAYWRNDVLEKRRALVEAWSGFCSGPPSEGEVVELRQA